MKTDFARELAIKILYKIEEDSGYSNLVLDEYLQKERQKLNEKDIGLISEIVYGTVTWKLTIDMILQKHSNIKINKISKWVKIILQTGIYQIVFLDKEGNTLTDESILGTGMNVKVGKTLEYTLIVT